MTKTSISGTETMKLDSQPGSNSSKSSKGKLFDRIVPSILKRTSKMPTSVAPVEEVLTFEQNLERGFLSNASQQLIDREERLLGQTSDQMTREENREEEEQLSRDKETLRRHIEQTLKTSLNPEQDTEVLKSAVKTIEQEEKQDRQWEERMRTPSAWRPGHYRELHNSVLRSLAGERLNEEETSSPPEGTEQLSSIQKDVCRMARQMKEDLLMVVKVVKGCYPDEMNICNLYAEIYHQALSKKMRKLAEYGLCVKDSSYLLQWVNDFYPQMLQKQEFIKEINHEALGKLLPQEVTKPLEDQCLTHTQEEVQTYISRMLKNEEQAWMEGTVPELRDGCCYSPLAADVIQCIDDTLKSVEVVLGNGGTTQVIGSLLKNFLNSFKNFQEDVQNKSKSKVNSRAVVMANIVCVEQFRGYIEKKTDLFPGDVKECCLSIVTNMKASSYGFILSPIHMELKPQYRKLGTGNWLKESSVFEELLEGIDKHMKDLKGLGDPCHQDLIGQFHQDVMVEYVRRLLKGNLRLKNQQKQQQAAEAVLDNGQRLNTLFTKEGSSKGWLTEILTWIAEVLKLQDVQTLQLEMGNQAATYPGLSNKHVAALLKLKSNLSDDDRTQVKGAFLDIQQKSKLGGERAFFANVKVK